MSNEKKAAAAEEVKERACELSMEELEKVTGSIEVGKSADMVVLDRNLYEIPAETIHETQPLFTVFRGEEVYRASAK